LLDLFQAFRQQLGVTLVKLDVALSCRASLKADSLADGECYGLGFGFAAALLSAGAALVTVHQFVCTAKRCG